MLTRAPPRAATAGDGNAATAFHAWAAFTAPPRAPAALTGTGGFPGIARGTGHRATPAGPRR
ncbi:hypothetical protein B1992_12390 [Pseudoxanthomonas broegbernensis]|uniref:Uncharacterized protein n=1 Tax=Pseudoxanthomonas broegbernensis TaxID=83619 RepID=A0A7V8GKY3_9GAMM|nr:hypothetical protein [Pseudoxanthomonas broegbernensis]KAF1685327.1 hypothetical protein B1992_12390 [Pseudoxanthomonas broegbernensis]MBB6066195.1 hypothetical protein [Pseudoxanthomonas broegbernensis]